MIWLLKQLAGIALSTLTVFYAFFAILFLATIWKLGFPAWPYRIYLSPMPAGFVIAGFWWLATKSRVKAQP